MRWSFALVACAMATSRMISIQPAVLCRPAHFGFLPRSIPTVTRGGSERGRDVDVQSDPVPRAAGQIAAHQEADERAEAERGLGQPQQQQPSGVVPVRRVAVPARVDVHRV